MDLREILKKHNIGIERLASLLSTSTRSLHRYEDNNPSLRDDTRARIELGLEMLEASVIVWPRNPWSPFDHLGQSIWRRECWECDRKFKRFMNKYVR